MTVYGASSAIAEAMAMSSREGTPSKSSNRSLMMPETPPPPPRASTATGPGSRAHQQTLSRRPVRFGIERCLAASSRWRAHLGTRIQIPGQVIQRCLEGVPVAGGDGDLAATDGAPAALVR